ncbi:hypothetical protein ASC85_01400 [Pseudomonas sp. Root401]|nr:hypothetical protein ASC85_01400 [Pseudomonas sp. Root401]
MCCLPSVQGVPRRASVLTLAILAVGVVLNYLAPAKVFIWLTAVAATGNMTTWIILLAAQLKFRRTLSVSEVKSHTFKMPWWPLSNYVTIAFMFFVLAIMSYVEDTRFGVIAGALWLLYLADVYWTIYRKRIGGNADGLKPSPALPIASTMNPQTASISVLTDLATKVLCWPAASFKEK